MLISNKMSSQANLLQFHNLLISSGTLRPVRTSASRQGNRAKSVKRRFRHNVDLRDSGCFDEDQWDRESPSRTNQTPKSILPATISQNLSRSPDHQVAQPSHGAEAKTKSRYLEKFSQKSSMQNLETRASQPLSGKDLTAPDQQPMNVRRSNLLDRLQELLQSKDSEFRAPTGESECEDGAKLVQSKSLWSPIGQSRNFFVTEPDRVSKQPIAQFPSLSSENAGFRKDKKNKKATLNGSSPGPRRQKKYTTLYIKYASQGEAQVDSEQRPESQGKPDCSLRASVQRSRGRLDRMLTEMSHPLLSQVLARRVEEKIILEQQRAKKKRESTASKAAKRQIHSSINHIGSQALHSARQANPQCRAQLDQSYKAYCQSKKLQQKANEKPYRSMKLRKERQKIPHLWIPFVDNLQESHQRCGSIVLNQSSPAPPHIDSIYRTASHAQGGEPPESPAQSLDQASLPINQKIGKVRLSQQSRNRLSVHHQPTQISSLETQQQLNIVKTNKSNLQEQISRILGLQSGQPSQNIQGRLSNLLLGQQQKTKTVRLSRKFEIKQRNTVQPSRQEQAQIEAEKLRAHLLSTVVNQPRLFTMTDKFIDIKNRRW